MSPIVFSRRRQSPASRTPRFTAASISVLALMATCAQAQAQQPTQLPAVPVTPPAAPGQKAVQPKAAPKQAAPVAKAQPKQAPSAPQQEAAPAQPAVATSAAAGTLPAPDTRSGSLSVPTTSEATADIQRTPGAVQVVPDTEFKNSPANTIKDTLASVPGVIIQNRWGPDARVSIRGSGLTRSYGNRGLNLYMDGIPINTSDGLTDLFEIDPSAYRYVEVFKGANALRFGSNSLGGAINFVTPTGYNSSAFDSRVDVGSFGYLRSQVSSGGVVGAWDYYVSLSAQRELGYRDHNNTDAERINANLGYRFSPNAETRFYVNANRWRAELPGEVTKEAALRRPREVASEFVRQDQQRNIDSLRVANKTTFRIDGTLVEVGAFTHQRHVDHPIFRYLDYTVSDFGGFIKVTDDRMIGGFRNRLIVGGNILDGKFDYQEYVNPGDAKKGALARDEIWKAKNHSVYAENSFFVLPNVALIAGGHYLHAVRDQRDRFFNDKSLPFNGFDAKADDSGRREFNIFSPKFGLLWDVDRSWQVFANVSRSAEVPTFDANTFTSPAGSNVDAQTATTYEIGTRGRRPDLTWDIALYRANIAKELQCLTTGTFAPCTVVNADRTIHQGVEAGLGIAIVKSVFANEDRFWLNTTYTYNDFHFDGDAKWGDNRLPGIGQHYVRAELLYKNPNGFFAGPNVEWMPDGFYADNANSLEVDGLALLNFRLGYDRGIGWSGYVEGRNLLDKRYISSTITIGDGRGTPLPNFGELYNPGTGIAVYGGLRYRM